MQWILEMILENTAGNQRPSKAFFGFRGLSGTKKASLFRILERSTAYFHLESQLHSMYHLLLGCPDLQGSEVGLSLLGQASAPHLLQRIPGAPVVCFPARGKRR